MPSFPSYDGLTIWYDRAGSGAPLIALGGGPGADVRYLGDLGGLDRSRELIRMDARAAGRTDVPADHATAAFTEQARDVEALRRHLGLERFDLLGHSAGSLTAQEYAVAYPGRVRRMVLVTPVGRVAREPDPAELAERRASRVDEPWYAAAAEADRILSAGPAPAGREAELAADQQGFFWHTWTDERRAEYLAEPRNGVAWLRAAFYAGAATPATASDRLARLAASPVPVLVVAGAYDGMIGVTPARLVAELHQYAELVTLDRSGHRPWREQPEEFRKVIADFLDAPGE
ncbi:alpha/beta fold hydrolase [Yinghuangia seranimata]|uniref:alpha/beta fold hydrolase n=1 Tax=Yinghuangia seranimata TaxID=408067 RepID=UPI00248B1848|nr:alpha/beta hydrolase [Yinghuangia seranimata]MDI2130712.1 alpha/beta hydrolase [Yinghuangia seranimata]